MSQGYVTLNPAKSGADYHTDLAANFDALLKSHLGSSRPAYAGAGTIWSDNSAAPTHTLKYYDGAQDISLFTIDTSGNTATVPNAARRDGADNYLVAGGTASAITGTLSPAPTSITAGFTVRIKLTNNITGTTTLNLNSLGDITIKKNGSTDLASGDFLTGDVLTLVSDGTVFHVLNTTRNASTLTYTSTELTIASDAITVTGAHHTIDTQGDAASDDLITISGMSAGQFVYLRLENASRTVNIKHNSGGGNIRTPRGQDILLDDLVKTVIGRRDGSGNVNILYDPTVANTAAVGSSLVLLATATASSSAALNFSGFFTSTYDDYIIKLVNIVPATDGAQVGIQVSLSASYLTSSYRWGSVDPTENAGGYSGGSGQSFVGVLGAVGNGTGEHGCGTVELFAPLSSSLYKLFNVASTWLSTTTTHASRAGGGFYSGSAGALDAFRVLASTGNITSGEVRLYGVRKA